MSKKRIILIPLCLLFLLGIVGTAQAERKISVLYNCNLMGKLLPLSS